MSSNSPIGDSTGALASNGDTTIAGFSILAGVVDGSSGLGVTEATVIVLSGIGTSGVPSEGSSRLTGFTSVVMGGVVVGPVAEGMTLTTSLSDGSTVWLSLFASAFARRGCLMTGGSGHENAGPSGLFGNAPAVSVGFNVEMRAILMPTPRSAAIVQPTR